MRETIMNWRDRLKDYPRHAPDFELDPQHTALMPIDMQYRSAHPDCGYGFFLKENFPRQHDYYFKRLREIVIPNQVRLVNFFRQNKLRIIYITLGANLPDGSDLMRCKASRVRDLERALGRTIWSFPPGSKERQVLEEIKPSERDLVVNKTSGGAFNSTAIERYLLDLGIEGLVICGVITDGCVINTAISAADRSFRCILTDDACATVDQEFHDAIMFQFARYFGKVFNTDEVIAYLTKRLEVANVPDK